MTPSEQITLMDAGQLTIPPMRALIKQLADSHKDAGNDHFARQLLGIEKHLHRRPYVRKATPKAPTMTAKLRAEIRDYACQHPHANYMEIGQHFGVSAGRVSEALAGKRGQP